MWLSVCLMGLIMVSCALHNEPHPHKKLSPLLCQFDEQHTLPGLKTQTANGRVAHISSKPRAREKNDMFGKITFAAVSAISSHSHLQILNT